MPSPSNEKFKSLLQKRQQRCLCQEPETFAQMPRTRQLAQRGDELVARVPKKESDRVQRREIYTLRSNSDVFTSSYRPSSREASWSSIDWVHLLIGGKRSGGNKVLFVSCSIPLHLCYFELIIRLPACFSNERTKNEHLSPLSRQVGCFSVSKVKSRVRIDWWLDNGVCTTITVIPQSSDAIWRIPSISWNVALDNAQSMGPLLVV